MLKLKYLTKLDQIPQLLSMETKKLKAVCNSFAFRTNEYYQSLIKMLSKYSTDKEKIYMIAHFNHPRELTKEAINAINMLQKAGVVTVNQNSHHII